eukprot:TRINITY_DN4303_c0_g1_i1.p1 TRINITY_DN4303_c0_g1~~TRINITY_DN4303_c0_g1_i1.p1  ORF type:complete len:298 (+),score=52.78 TRINITY_DN4303_c0_g1_i1:35-928(+)
MGEKPRSSWVSLVGGGLGGMTGAIITSPLEVIKTRMQSVNASTLAKPTITGSISSIVKTEGVAALWRGLVPSLLGVMPSRSIYFFSYDTAKSYLKKHREEDAVVYMLSAMFAGVTVTTIMNPVWVVKTRLQLQKTELNPKYRGTLHCFATILREEGLRSLYRGLTASYAGVSEGTIQFVTYERLKRAYADRQQQLTGHRIDAGPLWCFGLASASKLFASTVTYPHEVIRTRLREAGSVAKYNGFFHCLNKVYVEEGWRALYSGLVPHLAKTVPNAAVMFAVYELTLTTAKSFAASST